MIHSITKQFKKSHLTIKNMIPKTASRPMQPTTTAMMIAFRADKKILKYFYAKVKKRATGVMATKKLLS